MELLVGTSFIAAFIAGIAALFAPCCITVLLPSYFGSVFREKRKVYFMTFMFFLGILTVFLPLGLGISALGQFFSRYHLQIFSLVGLFFLGLGGLLISGKKLSMPFKINPTLKKYNAPSVFVLGIFSGIATTCCAPVLAGVLALSILPGSMFVGMLYTLSYVLGMVAPLFLIAMFLDKINLTKKFADASLPKKFNIFGIRIKVRIADMISGLTFLSMGVLTLIWAFQNKLAVHSEYQVNINIYLTKLLKGLTVFTGTIPEYVWGFGFLGLFILIVFRALRIARKEELETLKNETIESE